MCRRPSGGHLVETSFIDNMLAQAGDGESLYNVDIVQTNLSAFHSPRLYNQKLPEVT